MTTTAATLQDIEVPAALTAGAWWLAALLALLCVLLVVYVWRWQRQPRRRALRRLRALPAMSTDAAALAQILRDAGVAPSAALQQARFARQGCDHAQFARLKTETLDALEQLK